MRQIVSRLMFLASLVAVVLIFSYIISAWGDGSTRERDRSSSDSTAPLLPPADVIRLDAFSCSGDAYLGFAYARGRVTNISEQRLAHVQAIAEWYTPSLEFIVSDSALLDLDPLLPGQSSGFEVISRYNPRMDKCRVLLAELLGGELPTERP